MERYGLNETLFRWRVDTKGDPSDDLENNNRYQPLGLPEKWCVEQLYFREVLGKDTLGRRRQVAPKKQPKDNTFFQNMGVNIDFLIAAPGITEEARCILEKFKAPYDPDWLKKAVASGPDDNDTHS